jgi:hypothetical protein
MNSVKDKMKTYQKNFAKTVYGYIEVQAVNKNHAEKQHENGNFEEFDNKSYYDDFEEWEEK